MRHAATKGRASATASAPRSAMSSTARRSASAASAAGVARTAPARVDALRVEEATTDVPVADALLMALEAGLDGMGLQAPDAEDLEDPDEVDDLAAAEVTEDSSTRGPQSPTAHSAHSTQSIQTSPVGARDFGDGDARDTALHEQLRADLQLRINAYLSRGRARVVLTNNGHTMLSVKRSQDTWTLRIHHMFASAPPVVVRAIARYCEHHCPESSRILRAFVDAQEHLIAPSRVRRDVPLDTEGRHHDLREIFDALNARYFGGQVRARITWGPRAKRRRGRESIKLGSYTIEDELIRIHPVLDAADVPSYFVAYIVYHEMLHELHEMPIVDGRRVYHTAAFRRDEAKFEAYAEALEWERLHVHELLDR